MEGILYLNIVCLIIWANRQHVKVGASASTWARNCTIWSNQHNKAQFLKKSAKSSAFLKYLLKIVFKTLLIHLISKIFRHYLQCYFIITFRLITYENNGEKHSPPAHQLVIKQKGFFSIAHTIQDTSQI